MSGNVLAILSLCAEVATTATAKCSAMNWLKVSGYLFTQIGIGIRMYNICKYRRRRHYNEINGSVFEVDTINIVKARLNHTHKHHHRSSKRQRSKVSFTGRFYPSEHRETSWIGYYFCWSVAVLLILTFMLCWMFIEPSGFKVTPKLKRINYLCF